MTNFKRAGTSLLRIALACLFFSGSVYAGHLGPADSNISVCTDSMALAQEKLATVRHNFNSADLIAEMRAKHKGLSDRFKAYAAAMWEDARALEALQAAMDDVQGCLAADKTADNIEAASQLLHQSALRVNRSLALYERAIATEAEDMGIALQSLQRLALSGSHVRAVKRQGNQADMTVEQLANIAPAAGLSFANLSSFAALAAADDISIEIALATGEDTRLKAAFDNDSDALPEIIVTPESQSDRLLAHYMPELRQAGAAGMKFLGLMEKAINQMARQRELGEGF